MFDESELLVRHIRSCFIQGDESGQCEQALESNTKYHHSPPIGVPSQSEVEDG